MTVCAIGGWTWKLALCALIAVGLASAASAQVSHRVRLAAGPVVIAWEDGMMAGRGARVRLPGKYVAAAGFHAPRVVMTGQLEAVATVERPGLRPLAGARDPSQSVRTFRVASNSGFDLALDCPALKADADVTVSAVADGAAARLPGPSVAATRISAHGSHPVIYSGERRTAARQGTVLAQSVRFELRTTAAADLSACTIEIAALD